MRRRNVFAMGLALAIGGAGAAFLVDDSVAAPPPLLQLLSPPGAGYDSTNGVLYTGSGGAVTFTRADTWTCRDSDGTIRSLASGAPCVVDGHDGAGSLRVRSAVTNLLTYSSDFTQTAWTKNNLTVTADNAVAPDGTTTADRVTTSNTSGSILHQEAAVSATTATCSVYAKQGSGATEANAFLLRNTTTATNLLGITLDYSTGVITYTTGSAGATVESAGNGWWRVTLTSTITSGNTVRCYSGFTGVAIAGLYFYGWGAQLVAGSQPGDYCPTGASSDTCAAETATADFKGGVAPAASPWCVSARVTRATGDAAWNAGASSRRVWTNDVTGNGHAFVDVSTAGAVRLAVGDSAGTEKVWTAANALTDNTSANVRVCYSGSAGTVWVDGVSVAAAESGAGTGVLPSLTLTNYVGSTAGGTLQLNASLDTLCFSSSPNGCQ